MTCDRLVKAIKNFYGPDATIEDAPWRKRIIAGDLKLLRKAGEESRKITEDARKDCRDCQGSDYLAKHQQLPVFKRRGQ